MAAEQQALVQDRINEILADFVEKSQIAGSTEDSFLKLGSVKGSATDSKHKDEITVLFATQQISQTGGVNTAPGKATPSDYYFVIPVDQSYPILYQAAATGLTYDKAEIAYRHSNDGKQTEYLKVTLAGKVRVSLATLTSTQVAAHPTVVVIGLQFEKITNEHTPSKTSAGYDHKANDKL